MRRYGEDGMAFGAGWLCIIDHLEFSCNRDQIVSNYMFCLVMCQPCDDGGVERG